MSDLGVSLNEELGRFETTVDGQTAFITFRREGDRIVLLHTDVPDRLEGRGIGTAIVRGALAHLREKDETVVPQCPFVREFLERHRDEYADLKIERRAGGSGE